MLPIRLITFVMTTLITERSFSTPVYNMQPAQITANIGTMGRNIRHLPCVSLRTGTQGTCMFAIDCLKSNGTHLGTCIDRFYFGSCCHLPADSTRTPPPLDTLSGILDNTIDENDTIPPKYASSDNPISIPTLSTSTKFSTKYPTSTTILPSTTSTTQDSVNHAHIQNKTTIISIESTTMKIISNNTKTNVNNNSNTESITDKPFTLPLFQQKPETTTEKFVTSQSVETTTSKLNRFTTTQRPSTTSTTIKSTTKRVMPTRTTTIKPFNNTKLQTDKINFSSIENEVVKKPQIINTTKLHIETTTEIPYKLTTFQTINNQTTKPKPIKHTTIRPTPSSSSINTPKPKPRPSTTRKPITKPTYITKPIKITRPTTSTVPSVGKRNVTSATTTKRPTKPTKITTKIKPQTTTVKIPTTETPIKLTTILSPIVTSTVKISTSTIQSDNLTTKVNISSMLVPVQTIKPDQKIDNVTTVRAPTPSQHENEIITAEDETSSSTQYPPGLVTWTSIAQLSSPTTSTDSTMMEVTNTSSNIIEPDEWTPITPPDGWVLLPSVSPNSESPPKPSTHTTESSPTILPSTSTSSTTTEAEKFSPSVDFPTSTSNPSSSSSSSMKPIVFPTESTFSSSIPSVQINETIMNITTPKVPTLAEKINASITNMVFSSTTASSINENDDFTMRPDLNMSDYREAVCGRRMYPQARIVGGKNSTFGRWPWQISLRQWRTSTYLHKCGAALLNENWAITAAHCVDSVPPSDLLLRLGEHDLTSESEPYGFQERRVQIVASHPQFDPRTFEYDLALLRFYEPVTFQPNIIPVCVPNSDEGYVGKTAHVTGWGRLHEDGPLPNTLQEVSVPVINNSVCEQMYRSAGYIEHIPNIFICAGLRSGGSDSCEGDSGGPMVIQRSQDKRFILAGVISWGIGCAEPNQPGVYTRISEFRHWINQILQF